MTRSVHLLLIECCISIFLYTCILLITFSKLSLFLGRFFSANLDEVDAWLPRYFNKMYIEDGPSHIVKSSWSAVLQRPKDYHFCLISDLC